MNAMGFVARFGGSPQHCFCGGCDFSWVFSPLPRHGKSPYSLMKTLNYTEKEAAARTSSTGSKGNLSVRAGHQRDDTKRNAIPLLDWLLSKRDELLEAANAGRKRQTRIEDSARSLARCV